MRISLRPAALDPERMSGLVTTYVVLLVGAIACITDIRYRRIPNVLTFGAARPPWSFTCS
jgi:hypothetical protein